MRFSTSLLRDARRSWRALRTLAVWLCSTLAGRGRHILDIIMVTRQFSTSQDGQAPLARLTEDIRACIAYAARYVDHTVLAAS